MFFFTFLILSSFNRPFESFKRFNLPRNVSSLKNKIIKKVELKTSIGQKPINLNLKKFLNLKLNSRFIYLGEAKDFFIKVLRKIPSLGKFRIKIFSAFLGLGPAAKLTFIKPFLLNFLFFAKLGILVNTNFLFDYFIKRFIVDSIKKKAKPGSFYNLRFLRFLPVRGQRTKTNSRSARSYFKKISILSQK